MSIDSALNHVIIVADGQKLEDKTFPIPGGAQPPKNLAGKLLLLKFWLGFWFQSQNKVSQLNIFSRHLTLAEMVSRTAGEDCRLGNGDYLAWESSQWNLKGKAKFVSPRIKDTAFYCTDTVRPGRVWIIVRRSKAEDCQR